jgi:hypothetical protein
VPLVAELRHDFVLAGGPHHLADFVDGIDALVHLVKHPAEVAEDLGLREPSQIVAGSLRVHVA